MVETQYYCAYSGRKVPDSQRLKGMFKSKDRADAFAKKMEKQTKEQFLQQHEKHQAQFCGCEFKIIPSFEAMQIEKIKNKQDNMENIKYKFVGVYLK